jgi:hypothetical protein
MIRKRYRCRPSVESLESMVLLSGFPAATHHAAPALLTKLPNVSTATNVSGTLTGTFNLMLVGSLQTMDGAEGSGVVRPFGHTKVNGSFSLSTSERTLIGAFTLTTSKGNILVDASKTLGPAPLSMTVTKGTKQFKGIVGSGSGSLNYEPRDVNPHSLGKHLGNFNFTLTVNLNVTIPKG